MITPIYQADGDRILCRLGDPTWMSQEEASFRLSALYAAAKYGPEGQRERDLELFNQLIKAYWAITKDKESAE